MLKIKFEILIENMERVGGACWTCDVILEGGGGVLVAWHQPGYYNAGRNFLLDLC